MDEIDDSGSARSRRPWPSPQEESSSEVRSSACDASRAAAGVGWERSRNTRTDALEAVNLSAGVTSLEGAVDQLDDRVGALEAQEPPSSAVYVALREGGRVSGVTPVRVRAPLGTDWVGVYACGGQSVGEDSVIDASGEWSVQWDTRSCSKGPAGSDTWAS